MKITEKVSFNIASEAHYSKSQMFVQKFIFDKKPNILTNFSQNFILTIFLVESKLENQDKSINDLKEEARTTSVNYEEQLSMMSEHLANMNDKLTRQTDEIERLHFEMGNK